METFQNIDSAESEVQIARKLEFWANKLKGLGATNIAGVDIRRVNDNDWRIDLHLYVDKDSREFKDFMKRFR